jgi:thiamine biosynthesis lipoprotein
MNMPVTVEIADPILSSRDLPEVFDYFDHVEAKFSAYKNESEITNINKGKIEPAEYSSEMHEVFRLSAETKKATAGYFDIEYSSGQYDPSGLVKGWAIFKASQILKNKGYENFYVEAGGDVQVNGKNNQGQDWQIGIRNPFKQEEIIKVLALSDLGMATSGTYVRGQHIYNPHQKEEPILEIVSLTVIGPNVYEADRFATAAFAMGKAGIKFIEKTSSLEGYMINKDGLATMTGGFNQYVV